MKTEITAALSAIDKEIIKLTTARDLLAPLVGEPAGAELKKAEVAFATRPDAPTPVKRAKRGMKPMDIRRAKTKKPAAVAPDVAAAYRTEMHPEEATPMARPGSGRKPGAETVRVMAAMRTAPEPFTVASLKVSSGVENPKCISNAIVRAVAKGWLAKAGSGEYKRSGSFPATTPTED